MSSALFLDLEKESLQVRKFKVLVCKRFNIGLRVPNVRVKKVNQGLNIINNSFLDMDFKGGDE